MTVFQVTLLTLLLMLQVVAFPRATRCMPIQGASIRLEDGNPVKLRLSRTLSSADTKPDERVDFDVLEEVKVGELVVIEKGALAWGTVTEAQAKRRMGRAGKLDVNIDSVRLITGDKAALRAVKAVQGGGRTGAMTTGIVVTGLLVWPAAPFFLFMHGKDIAIPKGTEITAYINGNMNLDPLKFRAALRAEALSAVVAPAYSQNIGTNPSSLQPSSVPSPGVATVADIATVSVRSTTDGADITVDGKYVGSTPSTIRLPPGDHEILVEKEGMRWQRTMSVTPGGTLTINATLIQSPNQRTLPSPQILAVSSNPPQPATSQAVYWKAQVSGVVYLLRSAADRIYIEVSMPEESRKSGDSIIGDVGKVGNKYVGTLRERFTCEREGGSKNSCTLNYRIQLTSVTPSRIEGIQETPPPEAEFDCDKCSWSRYPVFQHFVWIPE